MAYEKLSIAKTAFVALIALLCTATASANSRSTYNITEFGAVGDGRTLNTGAIQKAIDTCTRNGGGTVEVPPGTYLIGTIEIKSNVTLHLSAGSELMASPDPNHLPERLPELRSYTDSYTKKAIVYAEKATNIAITGKGLINGQGEYYKGLSLERLYDGHRPFLVRLIECTNVTLRDVKLMNSPFWALHLLACKDVNVDGLRIDSYVTNNNDGIGIDSSEDVRISNCVIRSGDDAIVVKTTTPRPTQNVVVTNCVLSSHTNAFKIGTETVGDIRNITVSNCVARDGGMAVIALLAVDGGTVERINVSNIVAANVRGSAIFVRLGNRGRSYWVPREGDTEEAAPPKPGLSRMRDITIRDIHARGSSSIGCAITGLPGQNIENLRLDNVQVISVGGGTAADAQRQIADEADKYPEYNMFGTLPSYGFFCRHVRGLRMDNVQVGFSQKDLRPAFIFQDIEELELNAYRASLDQSVDHAVVLKNVRVASIDPPRARAGRYATIRVNDECENIVINESGPTYETKKAPVEEPPLSVLPEKIDGIAPTKMMKHYLDRHAFRALDQRDARLARVTNAAEARAYQDRTRTLMWEMLGGPLQRSPLNARVVGTIEQPTYRVERVIYESLPGFYVTGALFLPKSDGPHPAVLVSCGHSAIAKAYPLYQQGCIELAEHGVAALMIDTLGLGERNQLVDANGKVLAQAGMDHMYAGVSSMLVGRNVATYMIWDAIRGIDYLQSRKDIIPDRIGAAGNSGGGTITAYLMALEPRLNAAAPACFITSMRRLLQTMSADDMEQQFHRQLELGITQAEFVFNQAPRASLIAAAKRDFFPFDGTQDVFAEANRFWSLFGAEAQSELAQVDAEHGWHAHLRSETVRVMMRELLNRNTAVTPTKTPALKTELLFCAPDGKAMLLPHARSVYDINAEVAGQLAAERARKFADRSNEALRRDVRKHTRIRPASELAAPKATKLPPIQRTGYTIERLALRPEPGIWLPALLLVPAERTGPMVIHLSNDKAQAARPGGELEKLAQEGRIVLAVDLRGAGETKNPSTRHGHFHQDFDTNWQDVLVADMLGKSFLAMRTEDVIWSAKYLQERWPGQAIQIIAHGEFGPPALHAAALEPHLIEHLTLVRSITEWTQMVGYRQTHRQLVNAVHNVLAVYDMPDLITLLGNAVVIREPIRGDAARP